MSKLKISWDLCKASAAVVFQNRKLLWFPVVNTVFLCLIATFFLAPIAVSLAVYPTGYKLTQKEHWEALNKHYFRPETGAHPKIHPHTQPRDASHILSAYLTGKYDGEAGTQTQAHPFPFVCAFGLYFMSMFLATFFNVAFYSEIMCALNGQGVSFRRGFALARSRIPTILAWSLMAGAVGWLIRWVEGRLPFVGRLIVGFIGLAWSTAAVFAIPVIVQEKDEHNPLKILKQSALTLKRTWGEGLIGWAGTSIAELLILLGSFVVLAGLIALACLVHSWALGVAFVSIWLIAVILGFYLLRVGGQVYRCALYIFAAEGAVPGPYQREMMDLAWKIKGSSSPLSS